VIFNSGVYVLSKATIEYSTIAFSKMRTVTSGGEFHCVDRKGADEDVTMGICLRGIANNPLNTLDENLRNRFLIYNDTYHESSIWKNGTRDQKNYYWKYRPKYMGCCSEHLISTRNFKTKYEIYEDELLRLNRTYNYLKDWDKLPLPPRPRWFLYDDTTVEFEIDKFRNARPPIGQRIYINNTHDFFCWKCKKGDKFWIEDFDGHFKGAMPIFEPMNRNHSNSILKKDNLKINR